MFAKNIVVRLHVFLMIFTLAFVQPVAYASAAPAPKLDFLKIQNFVRTAGDATADYFFKKASNDPSYNAANDSNYWKKTSHQVSNSKLGSVAFKRILGLTGYGLAAFAIYEIVQELQKEGWTVDTANQEIYKMNGGPQFFVSAQTFDKKRFPSETAAINDFINTKWANTTPKPTFNGFTSNWTKPISELKVNEFAFRNFTVQQDTATLTYTIGVEMMPSSKQVATAADVAAVLPKVSDAQIASLMTSPDYLIEPHSPTAEAAAAAAPSSEPLPPVTSSLNPNPFALPVPNAPPTTNPDPNAPPTTDPNAPPTTTTPPAAVTPPMPAFCTYAQTLCEWLNWTKEAPNPPSDTKIPILDEPENPTELDTNQRINWQGGCPADPVVNLPMGMPSLELKFFSTFMCPWAEMMRPIFLFSGALISIYIVTGRGMSNG